MRKNLLVRMLPLLFALITSAAWAQERTVTGKVTSAEDGSGLPGVNVLVKGTTNGTVTDVDGKYSISAKDDDVLVFSFIGFVSQEAQVGQKTSIDMTMNSDVTQLSEVVVVGYGTQDRKKITSSQSILSFCIRLLPIA